MAYLSFALAPGPPLVPPLKLYGYEYPVELIDVALRIDMADLRKKLSFDF